MKRDPSDKKDFQINEKGFKSLHFKTPEFEPDETSLEFTYGCDISL